MYKETTFGTKQLAENWQYQKLQLCYLKQDEDNNYTNITPWCKCRDFLNDSLYCFLNKKPTFEIYNYKHPEFTNDYKILLGIKSEKQEELTNILYNFYYIAELENFYNLTNTSEVFQDTVENSNNIKKILIIKPSSFWLTDTIKFSLFTYLLRLCSYDLTSHNTKTIFDTILKESNYTSNDYGLIQSSLTEVYNYFILNLNTIIHSELYKNNLNELNDLYEYECDYSSDAVMIDAFETGKDLHSVTTSMLFGIPYEDCKKPENSEKRVFCKTANFSIAYGIGAQGLALRLQAGGIDADEAKCQEIIDGWYSSYKEAGQWLKKQRYLVNNAIKKFGWKQGQQGFVNLIAKDGRIIKTKFTVGDFSSEAGSKRDCMNFLLQNLNALATKKAMILMHAELKEKYPEAQLINVIHDECLVLVQNNDAEAVKEIVERCMIAGGEAFLDKVKVVADAKICQSWAEK
jgi:hypothetical protein